MFISQFITQEVRNAVSRSLGKQFIAEADPYRIPDSDLWAAAEALPISLYEAYPPAAGSMTERLVIIRETIRQLKA